MLRRGGFLFFSSQALSRWVDHAAAAQSLLRGGARPGVAWLGTAWPGQARRGTARFLIQVETARQGAARLGGVWRGVVWHGTARLGEARQGFSRTVKSSTMRFGGTRTRHGPRVVAPHLERATGRRRGCGRRWRQTAPSAMLQNRFCGALTVGRPEYRPRASQRRGGPILFVWRPRRRCHHHRNAAATLLRM
jgi:hypothetical protein